jgi:HEAT repeat protein
MKKLLILFLITVILFPLFGQDEGAGSLSDSENTAASGSAVSPEGSTDAASGNSAERPEKKTVEDQRLETIRYGTENEIAALIQTLKNENITSLDDELVILVQRTLNRSILTGVFTFFGDRAKGGLEDRALKAIAEWDEEANETIVAAIDYLGRVKNAAAVQPLEALLSADERRFTNAVFRALGRIAGGNEEIRDEIAGYLMNYYTERIPPDETRREIIIALGESGSREPLVFLSDIAKNNDERATLRMVVMDSLSKIGDSTALEVILEGVISQDPNLRSASVAALGPFTGAEVDHAILEAFRDIYYRTRIGAAQAAGKRKLIEAIPYLAYRAERDDVPAVKDEAIRALGEIGNKEAVSILTSLFAERKNSDRVRILSAEILIRDHPDEYAAKVIVELDEAKKKNQNPLYNGFLRVISTAKTDAVQDLVRRFLNSGGVVEKSYAMDMIANNRFQGFTGELETLTKEKNVTLSRKAETTLANLKDRELNTASN